MGKTYRNEKELSNHPKAVQTRNYRKRLRQERITRLATKKYGDPSWGIKEDWDDLTPTKFK
jgi:hypothetical protein